MQAIGLLEDVSIRQPFVSGKSQVAFNNKLLKRGPSFSKQQMQAALKWCKEYYRCNGCYLIVESKLHLTVWFEYSDKEIKSNLSALDRIMDDKQCVNQETITFSKKRNKLSQIFQMVKKDKQ